MPHARARSLGIPFRGQTGQWNAISDVAGVEVGTTTIVSGSAQAFGSPPAVRTGVTVILPRGKTSKDPVFAGTFNLNGAGEMTGVHWVAESGFLESPIGLTNTHSIGIVHQTIIEWQVEHNLLFGSFSLPVVAETYDGFLSDINGFHVERSHVVNAIESAASGPVVEGNVGGGTGMCLFGWKGGNGTSSRVTWTGESAYTVGAFVQANFGRRSEAVIAGVPVGLLLTEDDASVHWLDLHERSGRGSIIVIIATDAPLLPHQLDRVAKRAALGIGRTGGNGANSSGDIVLAFSSANAGAARADGLPSQVTSLANAGLDPLFEAAADATEEAIINALVAAKDTIGLEGRKIVAIPIPALLHALRSHGRLHER